MAHVLLTVCLYLLSINIWTEADSTLPPRMIFTEKETTMKRLPLPDHQAPVRMVQGEEPDTVTVVGHEHLTSFNFQNTQQAPVKRRVVWKECLDSGLSPSDCNYNITVVHQRKEGSQLFVCGTSGVETVCCDMTLLRESPVCAPSDKMGSMNEKIRRFIIMEGEPSVLVESDKSADLYITYSGSQKNVGIYKFGKENVQPASHDKEQHYVGLMASRQKADPLQDKVYGFYKEKNRDAGLDGDMWLPFVTQVCMADMGGPKNNLQFSWTSQMSARLFCGDTDSRRHFSQLVDVATVEAEPWQDTRVYALFRNEWGMSAVCVYSIGDINSVFANSPFKGDSTGSHGRRKCVPDSTKISTEVLKMIEKTSEMEQWVRPVHDSGPLLSNHHNYSHIYVDTSTHTRNNRHPVLFLSLQNGGIHKVTTNGSQSFVMAEYQPFNHRAHVLSLLLQPLSGKLHVSSRRELVQLDMANCTQHGDSCEECVLARDPYCGWNGTHCGPHTRDTKQDVAHGNPGICDSRSNVHHPGIVDRYSSDAGGAGQEVGGSIALPPGSMYFLQCPVRSRHARYTWHHRRSSTPCSPTETPCLVLIHAMGPQQAGTYSCVSEEQGYSRVMVKYRLELKNRAPGHHMSTLVWICLMAVLLILRE